MPQPDETYDVALCMYHDQALIPAKALGFDDAVNVTLGLPFIRTSPGPWHRICHRWNRKGAAGQPDRRLAHGSANGGTQHMTSIDGLPPLRDVIERFGLAPKKSLGQNFLLDLNLTSRIARASGPLDRY